MCVCVCVCVGGMEWNDTFFLAIGIYLYISLLCIPGVLFCLLYVVRVGFCSFAVVWLGVCGR